MPSTPHILVVDDFADGREMVAEYLAFRGFRVRQASGGSDALELARQDPPRIILMDLSMPGVDGWEATRQLKADQQTKDCIVIAVTAHAFSAEEHRARKAGCDGYVAKPFDLASLADGLAQIMAHGRRALPALVKWAPDRPPSSLGRT